MNLKQYIELFFERFPDKYFILKGILQESNTLEQKSINDINNFINNPTFYNIIHKNIYILLTQNFKKNYYNIQIINNEKENNNYPKNEIGYGILDNHKLSIYLNNKKYTYAELLLNKFFIYQSHIDNLVYYGKFEIISNILFTQETNIELTYKKTEILDLMSLHPSKLNEIFKNDIVWLVDQSPTNIDNTGSTLYIIDKNKIIKKKLTNEFMKNTTNGLNKNFKKLHWIVNNNDLIIGCWVGSGVVTIFNKKGEILDNWQDLKDPEATKTHAAYFTLDNKAILVANISNGNINYIKIENDKFTDSYNFSLNNWVKTLIPSEREKWTNTLRPITVRPFDTLRAGVTLSSGGFLILNINNPQNMFIEYYYTPDLMPGAGLLSYYDKTNQVLYVNHGVGTSTTSGESQSVLYYINNVIYNQYTIWEEPKTIYNKNNGDSHGLVAVNNYLYLVDRDLNGLDIVTLNNKKHKENILYDINLRDIGMDLIDVGKIDYSNNYNLYTSNRGNIPLSGNNPQINNAVGTQAGLSVINSDGVNNVINYILTIENFLTNEKKNISDCHGIIALK